MIRHAAAGLVLGTLLLSHPARAMAPGALPDGPGANPMSETALLGRPVILSDGQLLGRVAAAWKDRPTSVILQITVDARAGLAHDTLTLTLPGPVDPRVPIRLLLDRAAFLQRVSPALD